MRALSVLMKDIGTMDVALTFGMDGRPRNVALWAHRSILAQEPGLARLLNNLEGIESSPTGFTAITDIQSYYVTEYSLASYCCLIRFLYTSEISINVDLGDFAIRCPPTNPFSLHNKEKPDVEGLFPSAASLEPGSTTRKKRP